MQREINTLRQKMSQQRFVTKRNVLTSNNLTLHSQYSPRAKSECLWLGPPVVSAEDAAPVVCVVLGGPAGELLLQQTQPRTLRPGLDAVDLLVVESLQEAAHHPLESPASLRLTQGVKLALLHASETDFLVEIDSRVWLELVPALFGVRVNGEALTSGILVI